MTGSDGTKWRNSRSVTEIAPKSPFLFVNRSPIWFGMGSVSAHRVIRYIVDTESLAEPSCFLSRYVVGVPFVYFDYVLESCWLKTRDFVRVFGKLRLKTKDLRPGKLRPRRTGHHTQQNMKSGP